MSLGNMKVHAKIIYLYSQAYNLVLNINLTANAIVGRGE